MLTSASVMLSDLAAQALEAGAPAPDFSGTSTRGDPSRRTARAEGRPRLLLRRLHPALTQELIAFQKDLPAIGKRNAQALGASGDRLDTQRAFAKEHGIAFPLIDAADGTIRSLYDRGRVTFLIDREGIICFVQHGGPDNSKHLAELDKLP